MSEKKYRLHEEFEMSPNTMAIIPIEYGSKLYSKILELEDEMISPYRPLDIIKKSCKYFASSFAGKEGTKAIIGVTHKAPIVIDPLQNIYFFPTSSPSNHDDCVWISHEHVDSYCKSDVYNTEVIFRNKKSIILPVSFRSFENQMLRTALLRTKMLQRTNSTSSEGRYGTKSSWEMEAMEKRKGYRITE